MISSTKLFQGLVARFFDPVGKGLQGRLFRRHRRMGLGKTKADDEGAVGGDQGLPPLDCFIKVLKTSFRYAQTSPPAACDVQAVKAPPKTP